MSERLPNKTQFRLWQHIKMKAHYKGQPWYTDEVLFIIDFKHYIVVARSASNKNNQIYELNESFFVPYYGDARTLLEKFYDEEY